MKYEAQQNSERKGSLPGLFKKDADTLRGIHTMEGEVVRLEGDHYLVKRSDGKQVSLHVDDSTQVTRTFAPGERWASRAVDQSSFINN